MSLNKKKERLTYECAGLDLIGLIATWGKNK